MRDIHWPHHVLHRRTTPPVRLGIATVGIGPVEILQRQRRIGDLGLRAEAVGDAGDDLARHETGIGARDEQVRRTVDAQGHEVCVPIAVEVAEHRHFDFLVAGEAFTEQRVAIRPRHPGQPRSRTVAARRQRVTHVVGLEVAGVDHVQHIGAPIAVDIQEAGQVAEIHHAQRDRRQQAGAGVEFVVPVRTAAGAIEHIRQPIAVGVCVAHVVDRCPDHVVGRDRHRGGGDRLDGHRIGSDLQVNARAGTGGRRERRGPSVERRRHDLRLAVRACAGAGVFPGDGIAQIHQQIGRGIAVKIRKLHKAALGRGAGQDARTCVERIAAAWINGRRERGQIHIRNDGALCAPCEAAAAARHESRDRSFAGIGIDHIGQAVAIQVDQLHLPVGHVVRRNCRTQRGDDVLAVVENLRSAAAGGQEHTPTLSERAGDEQVVAAVAVVIEQLPAAVAALVDADRSVRRGLMSI